MQVASRFIGAGVLVLCLDVPTARAGAQKPGTDSTLFTRVIIDEVAPKLHVERVPVGAATYVLDSTAIMASTGESLSAALAARIPGLSVLRPGGSAAEGSRVRLRGQHSVFMTTEPIVIVDGVRVNAMQESNVVDPGIRTSRLDDIMPEDVARIEVLPGPAAASLYGPGAAGGAFVITTKRGEPGTIRLSTCVESRLGTVPGHFPTNYHRTGIENATGQPTTACDLVRVAAGACTPTGLEVWNPLEQARPFRMERAGAASVSLAGGIRETSVRLSASGRRTLGVTDGDDIGRLGLRASIAQTVASVVDVDGHWGYTRTSAGLPLAGLANGVIGSGLFGAAIDDANRGYTSSLSTTEQRQRASHWTAGGAASWRATSWLTARAVYGRDQLDQRDRRHETIDIFSSGPKEFRRFGDMTNTMTTTGAALTASYPPSSNRVIGGWTSVGYDRLGSVFSMTDSQATSLSKARRRWTVSGPWLRQQLAWKNRLVVGASVREESAEAFGERSSAWLKSADGSWMVGDLGRLGVVRLNAAYGEGRNWVSGNPALFSSTSGPFTDASAAEPVERTAESEVSIEAGRGKQTTVRVTAFRSDSRNLYLIGVRPPSPSFPSPFTVLPDGSMRNDGLELSAQARVLERGSIQWDASLSVATLRNRVRSLGSVPPIVTSTSRTAPGYPLRGYWHRPYTYADANGDGIIVPAEIQFTSDTIVFLGPSLPTREAALHSTLSLGSGLTTGALLDYRGGHKLSNTTERLRCRAYENCRAAQDPTAPLDDQARHVASRDISRFGSDQYVEDAAFFKLREVSLTWRVPARWANRLTGTGTTVTLAGRNLATWTHYKGLDPELDFQRGDQLPRAELAKLPLLREIVLRVEIGAGTWQ